MWIEFQAVLCAMFASLIFGYLYEIFKRSVILGISFFLLCFAMTMPFIPGWEEKEGILMFSRILTTVMVQTIL